MMYRLVDKKTVLAYRQNRVLFIFTIQHIKADCTASALFRSLLCPSYGLTAVPSGSLANSQL